MGKPRPGTGFIEQIHPRYVFALWLFLGLLIGLIAAASPNTSTVVPVYRASGQAWIDHAPLYNDSDDGFISLPQSAIVMVPLGPTSAL